jgi:hypothetical protein
MKAARRIGRCNSLSGTPSPRTGPPRRSSASTQAHSSWTFGVGTGAEGARGGGCSREQFGPEQGQKGIGWDSKGSDGVEFGPLGNGLGLG